MASESQTLIVLPPRRMDQQRHLAGRRELVEPRLAVARAVAEQRLLERDAGLLHRQPAAQRPRRNRAVADVDVEVRHASLSVPRTRRACGRRRPCRRCGAAPPRSGRSTTKAAATTSPPRRRISSTAASALPPVAMRSSTSSTRAPGATASACISTMSMPYSSEYSWPIVRHGQLALLADRYEAAAEHVGDGAAEDEAARLDTGDASMPASA